MSSVWADIQVEVKNEELLMVKGKESLSSIIQNYSPSQIVSGEARRDKWPRIVFDMLISSEHMTTLLIESVGKINQLFSSNITLQIPVVLFT